MAVCWMIAAFRIHSLYSLHSFHSLHSPIMRMTKRIYGQLFLLDEALRAGAV